MYEISSLSDKYRYSNHSLPHSCLCQRSKELHGISRIDIFQKFRNLRAIFRETQDQRVLICVRSDVCFCCACRMQYACMGICVMDLCMDSDLESHQWLVHISRRSGAKYCKFPEPGHYLTETFAIFAIACHWASHGCWENLLLTVRRSASEDLFDVPCIVCIDEGLGGFFLDSESRHD